jgi:hypothetical protein
MRELRRSPWWYVGRGKSAIGIHVDTVHVGLLG